MSHIGTMEVAHDSMVVIYDTGTGHILHIHQCVTIQGAEHPAPETLERDAFAQLSAAQPQATMNVATLHINSGDIKAESLYKVDTVKRAMIEMPRRQTTL
jgi:hypothetical protein